MIYALLALQVVNTLLIAVLAVLTVGNHTKLEWLRQVLIPWISSINAKLKLPK